MTIRRITSAGDALPRAISFLALLVVPGIAGCLEHPNQAVCAGFERQIFGDALVFNWTAQAERHAEHEWQSTFDVTHDELQHCEIVPGVAQWWQITPGSEGQPEPEFLLEQIMEFNGVKVYHLRHTIQGGPGTGGESGTIVQDSRMGFPGTLSHQVDQAPLHPGTNAARIWASLTLSPRGESETRYDIELGPGILESVDPSMWASAE